MEKFNACNIINNIIKTVLTDFENIESKIDECGGVFVEKTPQRIYIINNVCFIIQQDNLLFFPKEQLLFYYNWVYYNYLLYPHAFFKNCSTQGPYLDECWGIPIHNRTEYIELTKVLNAI